MRTLARILDGKRIAREIEAELAAEVSALESTAPIPCLAVIIVGEDPASLVYVRNKRLACERVGIRSEQVTLPADTSEVALLAEIERLNADPNVHGILLQLPLPKGMDERRMLQALDPAKDVDGFHPFHAGCLAQGLPGRVPATPAGILDLLRREGIELVGREAVVVGRSAIVGRPMASLLTSADATVTVCHSRTKDLGAVVRRADLVITAVGRPGLITADMVQPGAIVVDVGINRTPEGRLVGDVDFHAVKDVAGWITPVPGGVGPMTIAALLQNTLRAYRGK